MRDITVQDSSLGSTTVRLAASGDQVAFARLVSEHHASMMRVAYVITGDGDAAADAVQAAWSIAWRRLGSLRDHGHIRAWLVAIAGNEARQAVRRQRRASIVDISQALAVTGGDDPSDAVSVVDLRQAFARLRPDDRMLLALRYVAGMDSSEIATQLRLSGSGVRSRLARLLDRLRTDLEPGAGASR